MCCKFFGSQNIMTKRSTWQIFIHLYVRVLQLLSFLINLHNSPAIPCWEKECEFDIQLYKIHCVWFLLLSACRWVLLEVLDKIFPGSINWKQATKPPIRMPFRKVENCNQVIEVGTQLRFSLVNVSGNDIVQGNKKLILGNIFISLSFHTNVMTISV